MQMGTVRVWFKHANNRSWFEWAVARASGGERIHAEIELDSGSHKTSYTTFMNPPYNHVLQLNMEHRKPTHMWSCHEFRVDISRWNKIEHTCNSFLQRRYDYFGAVCSVMGRLGHFCSRFVNGSNKLFCSELVARALVAGGLLNMSDTECQSVSPESLARVVCCSERQTIKETSMEF